MWGRTQAKRRPSAEGRPSRERSANMASVRSRDTGPELIVRRILHHLGYRFRLHRSDLPGTLDICFPTRKKAIFVHGCFWHRHDGCARKTTPMTRSSFWASKFADNVARDRRNMSDLSECGWEAMVVWECETTDMESLVPRLKGFLDGNPERSMSRVWSSTGQ